MDIESRVDAQIYTERVLNNRKLFLATFCITACHISKSQTTYSQYALQVSPEEKKCLGGCLRKVSQAFKYLVKLDSANSFYFEREHSMARIEPRLDRPNLDYGNYQFQ